MPEFIDTTTPATRKPIMTLYSGQSCVYSHTCRIVLFEKEVECYIHILETDGYPEELPQLNPYNETPTLVDRDLVLYNSKIINEYLDERLPHPPLMPVDPVNRGKARLMIVRLMRDWYERVRHIESAGVPLDPSIQRTIRDGMIAISPVFLEQEFMMGDEFSLVDCFMAPLLWRLPLYGIDMPKQAKPIMDYANHLFERKAFLSSLTEAEQAIQ